MKDSVNQIKPMQVCQIIKHITEDYSMSLNYVLQRGTQQWKLLTKSNFVRRLLHELEMPPINICSQIDENGVETDYVTDGNNRCSTLISFANDGFAISSKVRKPLIEYTGIVYETTRTSGGKVRLKKSKKNGELIPVLDENGNKQRQKQVFDIRGAKFSTLPPELQQRFLEYAVPYIKVRDCSDEDIQQEILDFNSGKPMNTSQQGVALLGANCAKKIREIVNSSFVKNCCNFTKNDEINSVIERRIVETLMLLYGEFVRDYQKMCERAPQILTEENIQDFWTVLNALSETVEDKEVVYDYLGNCNGKELPIIICCYSKFRNNMGHQYDNKIFGCFLTEWVTDICNQKNIATEEDGKTVFKSYTEAYKQIHCSRGAMEDRIDEMYTQLELYMGVNGVNETSCNSNEDEFEDDIIESDDVDVDDIPESDITDDIDDVVEVNIVESEVAEDNIIENDTENIVEDEYDNPFEPISQFKNPLNEILYFSGREADIFSAQVLIASSELPEFRSANVDNETIRKFREYFNNSSSNEQLEITGNAEFYTGVLYDYLNDTLVDDGFITPDNLLSLMIVIPLTNVTDRIFKEWLADFAERSLSDEMYQGITSDKANYIMGRVNYMQTDLERYSKQYDYLNGMKVR